MENRRSFQPSEFSASIAAGCVLVVLAIILSVSLPQFSWGHAEWELVQSFEGRLRLSPYPALELARSLESPDHSKTSIYPLVNRAAGGFTRNMDSLDGQVVTVQAQIFGNGPVTMLYVDEQSIVPAERVISFPAAEQILDVSEVTVRGQIVDVASYAGLREPAFGDYLRSPAANSVLAGVAPILIVRDKDGRESALLLVDESKNPVTRQVVSQVAFPLEVRGKLAQWGGFPVLIANPGNYRRLLPWE